MSRHIAMFWLVSALRHLAASSLLNRHIVWRLAMCLNLRAARSVISEIYEELLHRVKG